jgi:uncharacterized protein YndB with AHSA1/START domain
MNVTSTDRIEKHVMIRAPVERVWTAVADPQSFGEWFGVDLSGAGQFRPGARLRGRMTHPGYEHVWFDVSVERVEPERLISWRWHPGATDPATDYSNEPTTLIVFELREVADGTVLSVVESGFDALPPERRAAAYRGNEEGWSAQMAAVERYVTAHA